MIKNKDGTLYRLSHPNPIMSEQSLWANKEKLIIHNTFGKKVIIDKNLKYVDQIEDDEKKPQTIFAVPFVEPKKINVEESIVKTQIWCLPAFYEEKIDPLYGEVHRKLRYAEKFVFEAVMEEHTDFQIAFWSGVELSQNSVLYPRNYDKRWWKVEACNRNHDKNLFFVTASPSDYQPHFS